MKRLLALACVLALALLGGCVLLAKDGDTVLESFDFTRVTELARAECMPEGARIISEVGSLADDEVTINLKFEKDDKIYKAQAVYEIVEAYELKDKKLSPSK